ncbi:DNA uptake protein [Vibrio ishigakensis]|uniref:DNA uptake protein n=2 Tax=Vibrio ishigakensis TaxID=1481914 RepID=A0A0B8QUJ6_9VIBR|nr:DNA uptake protein [Vibrio sp. JCM 19236]GAM77819.1 DNA uptake protein [Vibrio ishigakensis]
MSRVIPTILTLLMMLSPTALLAAENSEPMRDNGEYAGIEIRVNINTATSEELAAMLVGVGQKKAEHIVAFRELNGEFKSADDLKLVKGIGQATVDKNRERIEL